MVLGACQNARIQSTRSSSSVSHGASHMRQFSCFQLNRKRRRICSTSSLPLWLSLLFVLPLIAPPYRSCLLYYLGLQCTGVASREIIFFLPLPLEDWENSPKPSNNHGSGFGVVLGWAKVRKKERDWVH